MKVHATSNKTINENPLLPLVAFVVVIIGVMVVIMVVAIVAIIVTSSSLSPCLLHHVHSTLPFWFNIAMFVVASSSCDGLLFLFPGVF